MVIPLQGHHPGHFREKNCVGPHLYDTDQIGMSGRYQSNVLTTSFELQEEREGSRPTPRHYGFGANVEEGTSGAQRRLERSSNERRRWQSSDEQSSEGKRQ